MYRRGDLGGAQQVIDLLVVLGNDILLGSEQSVPSEDAGAIAADWSRWYTRAVRCSAGGRWLRTEPGAFIRVSLRHVGCSRPVTQGADRREMGRSA